MTIEYAWKIWNCLLQDGRKVAVKWYGKVDVDYVAEYFGLDNYKEYFE